MKNPRIVWVRYLRLWMCTDEATANVGLGSTPKAAYNWWKFGKRSIHGTARHSG